MWCSYLRGESVKSLVSKVAQRGQAFSVRGFTCSSFYPQVHRCLRGPPRLPLSAFASMSDFTVVRMLMHATMTEFFHAG